MTTRVGSTVSAGSDASRSRPSSSAAPDIEVVAVNDLVDAEMNALLFKHDSTYGAYDGRGQGRSLVDHRRRARDQVPRGA